METRDFWGKLVPRAGKGGMSDIKRLHPVRIEMLTRRPCGKAFFGGDGFTMDPDHAISNGRDRFRLVHHRALAAR